MEAVRPKLAAAWRTPELGTTRRPCGLICHFRLRVPVHRFSEGMLQKGTGAEFQSLPARSSESWPAMPDNHRPLNAWEPICRHCLRRAVRTAGGPTQVVALILGTVHCHRSCNKASDASLDFGSLVCLLFPGSRRRHRNTARLRT